MKNQITLQIADVVLSFNIIANEKFLKDLITRYESYIVTSDASFTFDFFESSMEIKRKDDELINFQKTGDLLEFTRFDFKISFQNKCGKIFSWPSVYSFDSILRILISHLVTQKKGLLIHSSCILYDSEAYLFPGQSGAGKSTIAKLSKGKVVVNDELCILTLMHNEYVIWGSPFWGELGTGPNLKRYFPLRAIMFPIQNNFTYIEEIGLDKACVKLLKCVCNYDHNNHDSQTLLQNCYKVLFDSMYAQMNFTKDPEFWESIHEFLKTKMISVA